MTKIKAFLLNPFAVVTLYFSVVTVVSIALTI